MLKVGYCRVPTWPSGVQTTRHAIFESALLTYSQTYSDIDNRIARRVFRSRLLPMRLVDLVDDLIFEIAFYLDVFAARSLSQVRSVFSFAEVPLNSISHIPQTCSRIFRLSKYEPAYWSTVLFNHQKFEPTRLLPLPPYHDVRKLNSSQLRDLVDHMIQLEKNLCRQRPTYRQPPIECKIQYRPTSFDIIPGTPLIIFRSSSTTTTFCFDYEQRSVLCEVVDIFSLTPISPLYHEYGKCTQIIRRQPLFQPEAESVYHLQCPCLNFNPLIH